MFYVYILKGTNRRYIGRTENFRNRVKEHLRGKVWTSKRMKKVELIFYEAFKSKEDAIRREKYFKTTKGKKGLKLMLRASLK